MGRAAASRLQFAFTIGWHIIFPSFTIGLASFLAVLKIFGDIASPGMLSFPRPGLTIALDFPLRDLTTFGLCNDLDAIVREAGGAVYPAKDARMSAAAFREFYPRIEEFRRFVDPGFSSSLWRRLTES